MEEEPDIHEELLVEMFGAVVDFGAELAESVQVYRLVGIADDKCRGAEGVFFDINLRFL